MNQQTASRDTRGSDVTHDANKALIRRVFEEVIPAGNTSAMRDAMAPDFLDHDPLPGQPAGAAGGEYAVSTTHTAHPDLTFGSRSGGRCAAPTPARCSAGHPAVSRSSWRPS